MKKEKKNSDQTNKQERARNPQYKQDQVLLFTVNKDNWSIRRVFESHGHHNAHGCLPAKITKISPTLQTWFLY